MWLSLGQIQRDLQACLHLALLPAAASLSLTPRRLLPAPIVLCRHPVQPATGSKHVRSLSGFAIYWEPPWLCGMISAIVISNEHNAHLLSHALARSCAKGFVGIILGTQGNSLRCRCNYSH